MRTLGGLSKGNVGTTGLWKREGYLEKDLSKGSEGAAMLKPGCSSWGVLTWGT